MAVVNLQNHLPTWRWLALFALLAGCGAAAGGGGGGTPAITAGSACSLEGMTSCGLATGASAVLNCSGGHWQSQEACKQGWFCKSVGGTPVCAAPAGASDATAGADVLVEPEVKTSGAGQCEPCAGDYACIAGLACDKPAFVCKTPGQIQAGGVFCDVDCKLQKACPGCVAKEGECVCTAPKADWDAPKCEQCADYKFTGPKCDQCADAKKTGSLCDKCAPKFTGLPSCSKCTDPKFTGDNCDDCVDPNKTGATCDACLPQFTGAQCKACVLPKMTGLLCEKCVDYSSCLSVVGETVYDGRTDSWWQRNVAETKYELQGGKDYCAALTLAQQTDWRLPTSYEFKKLLDGYDTDSKVFPPFGSDSFLWSSDEVASGDGVYIDWPSGYSYGADEYESKFVRCVRGK